jgi:TolB-like protein
MSSPLGARLGSYRILSRLGAGGMGEVYRAHDEKLGRDVALKVLPPELADDRERRAALLREARAAASLNHPNLCTIHDVGEADSRAYIAMEVVEGEPLSRRLAQGSLSVDEILRLGRQLAEAVAHAHDRGIVHRDLKSANVMVTPEGRVKVLDFGLAKQLSAQAVADVTTQSYQSLSMPGTILGTLPYMAPEQLRAQPADARTDVWALGVVLYEMAAGQHPFEGQTSFELSSAILHEPPRPLPPRLPAALQAMINRCLEKEPARRYQRASEVRAALDTLADTNAHSQPAPVSALRRRRLISAASLAVALGLAAAALWLNLPAIRQRLAGGQGDQIRSIAVLPLENLSGDPNEEYFVAGMHEALITDLARIRLDKVIAKPSADAFKGTKKPLRDIGRELGVEGLVTGSVMRVNNRVQVTAQLVDAESGAVVWANRYDRSAGDILSLQNELVGAIAREVRATIKGEPAEPVAVAHAVNPAAHDAYLKGRSLYAAYTAFGTRKQLDAAIAQLEQTIQIDPTYAPPYAMLTTAYLAGSQTSVMKPNEAGPKARAAALKAVELDDGLAAAHAALGEVYLWYDWNWAAVDRETQRALQLNPDSTDALRSAQTYQTLIASRFDEAARMSQRILDLDPLNPFSRVQTVWVSFFSRKHDESIGRAKSLLEVSPQNLMGPYFLASNYAVRRMGPEVKAECDKALALLGTTYAMKIMGTCVWALAVVGQTDEARRLLRRVEQPPPGTWLDPVVMAEAYGGLGEIDRAIEWYQKGLEDRSPTMIYLKVGAPFDPARGDPRFQALLRQMNFPG